MAITGITSTDNFKTWFNKTNEIITQVNLQEVLGVTGVSGSNGIGVSYENGLNMVYIKRSIPHAITFSNDVQIQGNATINGTLSVGSINVNKTILSYTPKKSGLTAGNVVRIDSVLGLTLAKADSADNAEVFGIIVGEDANSNLVAVNGKIDNSTFSKTIDNALKITGGTLGYGSVYFLSPTVAGGITSIEPNNYGHVSRPILLGITGSEGNILQYRGILIEGISAGITAELDNKIILQVDCGIATWGVTGTVSVGDPVYYFGEFSSTSQMPANLKAPSTDIKIRGASNNNTVANTMVLNFGSTLSARTYCIGAISKLISYVDPVYIVEVTTRGGNFDATFDELDPNIYSKAGITGGIYKLNTTSNKFEPNSDLKNTSWATIIRNNDANNTVRFLLDHTEFADGPGISQLVSGDVYNVTYGVTSSNQQNLLVNGGFSVWQRNYVDYITTTSFTDPYFTTICDRWFLDTHGCTAFSVTLMKNEFENTQTEVPGAPRYWITYQNDSFTLRNSGNLAQRPKLQNIQKGARLLQGQTATMSFYAKAGLSGATLHPFYNRLKDSYTTVNGLTTAIESRTLLNTSGVTLTADWKQYTVTFTPNAGITLDPTEEGWFAVGFEFPNTTDYDLAQVRLTPGMSSIEPLYTEFEKELQECKRYYQTSYSYGMFGGTDQDNNKNEANIDLINLNSIRNYNIRFPVKMVAIPENVDIYSPVTGTAADAYNVSAGQDMRNSAATIINAPWTVTNPFRTALISGNITVTRKIAEGFDVTIHNGAYSGDRIKFHWVADADIDKTII